MDWPAQTVELNPIAHARDNLERDVAALNPPPQTLVPLTTILQELF